MSPRKLRVVLALLLSAAFSACLSGAGESPAAPGAAPAPWRSDQGDGTYRNPVLFTDYADPDCIRLGTTYYAVASSFNLAPGLPLLVSEDLVNWRLVGHALPRLVPDAHFSVPRRGEGVWAPSLRHHNGLFHIYYPDPDFGIYLVTAERFEGPWSAPVLVLSGKGLIDPCPLWDDDGRVYLVYAWAKSRAGIGNMIGLCELSSDGRRALGETKVVIDGNKLPGYRTLEGPKFYKRNGEYWIFAPAGGVPEGWQSVFRASTPQGPYQDRIVLEQGATEVNGPHQGAWVDTPEGTHWFLHFQDRGPFGRIPHLQPMYWREDGWPVMGADPDGDGRGQPVLRHAKPVPGAPAALPFPRSETFSAPQLATQWQWECNPPADAHSLSERPGHLRLRAFPSPSVWLAGNVLSIAVPGPGSVNTTCLDLSEATVGTRAGLAVLARESTWLEARRTETGLELARGLRPETPRGAPEPPEQFSSPLRLESTRVWFRVCVAEGRPWTFSYSANGRDFLPLGKGWEARKGLWLGARLGLFAIAKEGDRRPAHCDFDDFLIEALP